MLTNLLLVAPAFAQDVNLTPKGQWANLGNLKTFKNLLANLLGMLRSMIAKSNLHRKGTRVPSTRQ